MKPKSAYRLSARTDYATPLDLRNAMYASAYTQASEMVIGMASSYETVPFM